ncbi:hypothetical protein [Youxingia wuxianensis]|uniref:CARDB domain-containing protein n=1 Tax=Youxingia wuxianensis TaxID=2763678 RepID=A0A926EIP1_9FIRM|nr:hypothetical protein [Youxingia wuxianensis]MBC8584073.1 hypothetical protein [Youxingia wuxianensis]
MNSFSNRAISLMLAIVFLLSAGLCGFFLLAGMTVKAADDAIVQSIKYFEAESSGGFQLPEIRPGTTIGRLRITVIDYQTTVDDFNSVPKEKFSFSFSSSRKVFDGARAGSAVFSDAVEATNVEKPGISYTVDLFDLKYNGSDDIFVFNINYPSKESDADSIPDSINGRTLRFAEKLPDCVIAESSSRRHDSDDDDDDDDTSSRPFIAPATPNIIVTSYDYGGSSVTAAGNFSLNLKFYNTSSRLYADNIVMKVTVPEAFTMNNSSNTFYIERMRPNETLERTLNLSVKPSAEPQSHPIKLAFTFEAIIDDERKQFTSEEEISIPVNQLNRFSLNPMELPETLYVGEEQSFSVTFVNKGKTPIYNITASIEGTNLAKPGQQQFFGNLDEGKEDSIDFYISPTEAGPIVGEVILTYEDANMNVTELRTGFSANGESYDMPADMMGGMDDMGMEDIPMEEPKWYQKIPVWGWGIAVVVIIIFVAFIIKLLKAKKAKKLEDEDEDF